ncbi:hypothetical protein ASE36_21820 [Rhizobium sp. Root274]|uniref:hypothetical protein n=1 Tax=unclassified Rhizobium TaxID=2613769 RepID=UPI000714C2F4|nr:MULTISPECIES: hypothetical protein [unclassified Rhizobium]KQW30258.1 hypothetical protein ASC71_21880 [Rhizobium sp. Root1240]KRD31749.1 hypothetical protein ASE36_21820 [Rhizobium sp. Root274]
MGQFKLDTRARFSIDIALAAAGGDDERLRLSEQSARSLGFTGAELDALRQGSSFDFQLSRAITLALAPDSDSRDRARRAGLDEQVCQAIEAFAAAKSGRPT